ncbi:putative necrosis-inducing factor-domain-containing protein [Aspergillus pseudotamarii]|uniref:Putative necrosis-inducing factor-domain-containing protein n=1 Tax=Aspergillus pseudotamarii TaxID=132259 RepID=A0A5N6S8M6_ASPPS|nr:putative necrosis-inducing factor-domain-containing protein [Aspergillus pseudotamarii]KAE8130935.1 putative necrosis-inducing factor-domain-containing protein [Aspergillus pseudotamarii]
MHLQIAAVFATLLALAQAAPTTQSLNANSPGVIFVQSTSNAMIDDCGDSTFENQTSDASPLVSDCQQITRNIAGGGTWEVEDFGGQHQLVQYGTCAFGVTGDKSINGFYVGNSDIIDLINDSISRYNWNGKVGSKGSMGCQSLTGLMGGVTVTWGLYHTS